MANDYDYIIIFNVIYYLLLTPITIARRKILPLSVRPFSITILTIISALGLTTLPVKTFSYFQICDNADYTNADITTFFTIIFMSSFCTLIVIRGYRLVRIFDWNFYIKLKEGTAEKIKNLKSSVSEKNLLKIFVVVTLINALIAYFIVYFDGLTTIDCPLYEFIIATCYNAIIFSLCCCWIAYRTWRQPRDVFYLKFELILCSFVAIFNTIGYIIIISTVNEYEIFDVISGYTSYFIASLHFCVIVFPTILTFIPKINIFNSEEKILGLHTILKQPDLLELFTEYLIKELSVENILFYQRVENLKIMIEADSNTNDKKAHKEANFIIERFIKENSEMQINLDHYIRQQAITDFNQSNSFNGLFEAEKHIFDTMREDSYPRFVTSNDYKDYLKGKKNIKKNLFHKNCTVIEFF